jgi:quercetin dioxygenase-like cupin family protein
MEVYNPDALEGTHEYGGTVKIIVDGSKGSNLASGVFSLEPGEDLVPDIHDSDEVFFILEGTLTLRDQDGEEDHQAKAGEMVLIPKGQVHLSSNQGQETVMVFWAHADT